MDGPTRVTADPRQVAALPPIVARFVSERLKPTLEEDPTHGDRITRKLWPKQFRENPNLFRVELPQAHRAVYTIMTYPGRPREVRILWLGIHKRYDRLFGYSTS